MQIIKYFEMNIKEHSIQISKTAQYYTKGEDVSKCKYLWIMCHGYGMLAENILDKMDWTDEDHFLVSIEGLSKFYWNGVTGRPVASWMTKKNRMSEIADYSNYLSLIYNKYTALITEDTKIILFGFSQGGTTVWRWIHRMNVDFDLFLNYAGWVPEDIDFTPEQLSKLSKKKLWMLYGDKDEYLTDDRITALENVLKKHKFDIHFRKFEGAHKVNGNAVQDAFNAYKAICQA